jgi:hypothetical protein
MTFPVTNLDQAAEPFRAEIIAAAHIQNDTIHITTRNYHAIAKKHNIDYLKAQSIALGETQLSIGGRMLKNFASVALKTLVSGQPSKVTEEIELARKKICEGCDEYLPEQKRCAKCGCAEKTYLPDKWQWTQSTCPEDYWPKPGEAVAT